MLSNPGGETEWHLRKLATEVLPPGEEIIAMGNCGETARDA